MAHTLKQLHALYSFLSPDLLDQVEDVWEQILEIVRSPIDFKSLVSQIFPDPTSPPMTTATPNPIKQFPTALPTVIASDFPPFNLLVNLSAELCTQDQQGIYDFIDDACRKIEDTCLSYIASDEHREYFSRNLETYCLHRRRQYIEIMEPYCQTYGRGYNVFLMPHLIFREQFMAETRKQMILQLESITVEIVMDTEVELANVTVFDEDTFHHYNLHIIHTGNKTLHMNILNSIFHRIYIYLNNNKISAVIKDNVFIESGVTIGLVLNIVLAATKRNPR